jgi:hypothetical protein
MRLHAWKTVEEARRQWTEALIERALRRDAGCALAAEIAAGLIANEDGQTVVETFVRSYEREWQNFVNGMVMMKIFAKRLGSANVGIGEQLRELRERVGGIETEGDVTRILRGE